MLSVVPHGSILGPLQFILLFNDIPNVMEGTRRVKYVDNTMLYGVDKNMTVTKTELLKVRDYIADWLDENGLVISLKESKAESLLFRLCIQL